MSAFQDLAGADCSGSNAMFKLAEHATADRSLQRVRPHRPRPGSHAWATRCLTSRPAVVLPDAAGALQDVATGEPLRQDAGPLRFGQARDDRVRRPPRPRSISYGHSRYAMARHRFSGVARSAGRGLPGGASAGGARRPEHVPAHLPAAPAAAHGRRRLGRRIPAHVAAPRGPGPL